MTATDVNDVGKVLTRFVAGDIEADNRGVDAGGDTGSYRELGQVVESVTGTRVAR